ncbi:hypothetical protein KAFR_0C00520 [Kazachstania africana CBS 2517]|uniref:Uncharacterized protein n=1 Tax=Kazachstania africana (strain ATCC 22294 / BCRC 22015 / CBS 2517 / CECT 1963 / NBRC 1671 / NRRL Y-8276) TaxID=1071382 RepID=H2ARP7_KAZAF|nr:hypothetical protein KAFR_0C00520 [Kazachstania africana CBS 2517]CCF57047.1 hypothetical protein KAFR_0C00520 [Kazachstania africana CBS 2517]
MNYMNYTFDPQQQQNIPSSSIDASFSNLSFNNGSSNTTNGSQLYDSNIKYMHFNNNVSANTSLDLENSNSNNNNNNNNNSNNSNTNSSNNNNNSSNNKSSSNNNSYDETIEKLKVNLQIKDSQIESLENEIIALKNLFNKKATNDTIQIPKNIENIIIKLSDTLAEKESQLSKTQETLETILTSISLNPTNGITENGRYDVETISHKLLNKLEILTNENDKMSKMLSFGRSKELQIKSNLLELENAELKKRVTDLEKKLSQK